MARHNVSSGEVAYDIQRHNQIVEQSGRGGVLFGSGRPPLDGEIAYDIQRRNQVLEENGINPYGGGPCFGPPPGIVMGAAYGEGGIALHIGKHFSIGIGGPVYPRVIAEPVVYQQPGYAYGGEPQPGYGGGQQQVGAGQFGGPVDMSLGRAKSDGEIAHDLQMANRHLNEAMRDQDGSRIQMAQQEVNFERAVQLERQREEMAARGINPFPNGNGVGPASGSYPAPGAYPSTGGSGGDPTHTYPAPDTHQSPPPPPTGEVIHGSNGAAFRAGDKISVAEHLNDVADKTGLQFTVENGIIKAPAGELGQVIKNDPALAHRLMGDVEGQVHFGYDPKANMLVVRDLTEDGLKRFQASATAIGVGVQTGSLQATHDEMDRIAALNAAHTTPTSPAAPPASDPSVPPPVNPPASSSPPPATAPDLNKVLHPGSEGGDVLFAQKMLKAEGMELGPYGPNNSGLDGKYGEVTGTAAQQWKEKYNSEHKGDAGFTALSTDKTLSESEFKIMAQDLAKKGHAEFLQQIQQVEQSSSTPAPPAAQAEAQASNLHAQVHNILFAGGLKDVKDPDSVQNTGNGKLDLEQAKNLLFGNLEFTHVDGHAHSSVQRIPSTKLIETGGPEMRS